MASSSEVKATTIHRGQCSAPRNAKATNNPTPLEIGNTAASRQSTCPEASEAQTAAMQFAMVIKPLSKATITIKRQSSSFVLRPDTSRQPASRTDNAMDHRASCHKENCQLN